MDSIDSLLVNILGSTFQNYKDKDKLIMDCRFGLKNYLSNLRDTLGDIQLHRSNMIRKIEDIFIEVKLLDYIISERYFNEKFIPQIETLQNKKLDSLRNPKDVIRQSIVKNDDLKTKYQIIEQYHKIILLGQPGSGKSTLAKKICLDIVNHNKLNYIPIFLSLKDTTSSTYNIKEEIINTFNKFGVKNTNYIVEQILSKGKFLICFDGLDETPIIYRYRILNQILITSSDYTNIKCIVTSRLSDYKGELAMYKEIEVCDFTQKDISNFIKKWFFNVKDTPYTDKLINKVFDNPQLVEIATTPLLLSLLCFVYEFDLDISVRRTTTLQRCIECLLREWDAQRSFRRDTLYSKLDDPKKIALLSHLSYSLHSNNQIYFNNNDLFKHLELFIESYGIEKTSLFDVIQEIKSHYGFIQSITRDVSAFSHLTFQEYFTSIHIITNNIWRDEIDKHIEDSFWEEVLTMGAALLPSASEYIEYIYRKHCKSKKNIVLAGLCLTLEPFVNVHLKTMVLNAVKTEYFNNPSNDLRRMCFKILDKVG